MPARSKLFAPNSRRFTWLKAASLRGMRSQYRIPTRSTARTPRPCWRRWRQPPPVARTCLAGHGSRTVCGGTAGVPTTKVRPSRYEESWRVDLPVENHLAAARVRRHQRTTFSRGRGSSTSRQPPSAGDVFRGAGLPGASAGSTIGRPGRGPSSPRLALTLRPRRTALARRWSSGTAPGTRCLLAHRPVRGQLDAGVRTVEGFRRA